MRTRLAIVLSLGASALTAQVAPAPAPPAAAVIILTDHALDGRGGVLNNARIGVSRRGRSRRSPRRRRAPRPPSTSAAIPCSPVGSIRTCTSTRTSIARDTTRRAPSPRRKRRSAWRTTRGSRSWRDSRPSIRRRELGRAVARHDSRSRTSRSARLTSLSPIQADTSVSSDSLRAMVRRRKELGADLIKIFASKSQRVGATPTITEDQLRVLCDEAKAVGLRSMVHAYRSQTGAAARAGCREIEHATYSTQADIDAAVRAGAYLSPQVGLVVQNYLENRARYVGVGGFTDEGMNIMERDLPRDFEICTLAVHTPRRKGRVLDRRDGGCARTQRRGVRGTRRALRAVADGGARFGQLAGRRGDWDERSHRIAHGGLRGGPHRARRRSSRGHHGRAACGVRDARWRRVQIRGSEAQVTSYECRSLRTPRTVHSRAHPSFARFPSQLQQIPDSAARSLTATASSVSSALVAWRRCTSRVTSSTAAMSRSKHSTPISQRRSAASGFCARSRWPRVCRIRTSSRCSIQERPREFSTM